MGKIRTTCVHIHAHIRLHTRSHARSSFFGFFFTCTVIIFWVFFLRKSVIFFCQKKSQAKCFSNFFSKIFFKFFFVGLHLPFQFSDCPGGCKIFFSFCFQISECLGGCKEAGSAGVSACVYPSPPSHTPSRSSDTAPRKPSRKEGESCGFRSTSYCLAAAAAY